MSFSVNSTKIRTSTRVIVAVIFFALQTSLAAFPIVAFSEYGSDTFWILLRQYAHLFFYFPVFGFVILAGFYAATCVIVEFYLKHIKFGSARLFFAVATLALTSTWLAGVVFTPKVSVWEISPQQLAGDLGNPKGCAPPNCKRVPFAEAITELQRLAGHIKSMTPFLRDCRPSSLLEPDVSEQSRRYCFASRSKLNAPDCCMAQAIFSHDLQEIIIDPAGRSATKTYSAWFGPISTFVIFGSSFVGVMLIALKANLDRAYSAEIERMGRDVLIGSLSLLLFLIMAMSGQRSEALLQGNAGGVISDLMSPLLLSFVLLAFLLIVTFYKRRERESVKAVAQMGAIVGATYFFVNTDSIVDFCNRYAGVGGDGLSFAAITAVAAFFLAYIFFDYFASPRKPSV